MDFRTDVSIAPSATPVTLKTPILTAGSCFADAIGVRLEKNKFETLNNPFGVVYNPVSIHRQFLRAIANEPLPPHSFLENNGIHANYEFHSSFSSTNAAEIQARLTNAIGSVHYFLKNASHILITYGTALVYLRKDTGDIVANCHKIPNSEFDKNLLRESEVIDSFGEFHSALVRFNPQAKIILTLSPVRHLRDTLELNSASKAVLRSAIHSIRTNFAGVEYFPAYEIMMDELRDYRFYRRDMIHPTTQAEDYIWEKFSEYCFDADTRAFIKEWASISAALNHRPFHPRAASHQEFLKQTLRRLQALERAVDVQAEIKLVKQQLADEV